MKSSSSCLTLDSCWCWRLCVVVGSVVETVYGPFGASAFSLRYNLQI